MKEHRLIMSNFLGREIDSKEFVHHINENPKDNRIENLLLVNQSEHNVIHKWNKKLSDEIRLNMSLGMTGKLKSESHKRNISKATTGVPKSESHRKSLSRSATGRIMLEKSKDKIRGELNHNFKITDANIIEIKNKYSSGTYTYARLGEEYSISGVHIGRLIRGTRRKNARLST